MLGLGSPLLLKYKRHHAPRSVYICQRAPAAQYID